MFAYLDAEDKHWAIIWQDTKISSRSAKNKVRAFAKAKGLYAKTDGLDAQLLVDYAQAFQVPAQPLSLSPALREIQDLLTRRQQLIDLKTQEICRLDVQTSLVLRHPWKAILTGLHKK